MHIGGYMYKIFIDTNIILDFYRINNKDNIKNIITEINKHKKYLISTQQSDDEFLRNREKTMNEFIDKLKNQKNNPYSNNFIATLNEFGKYKDSIETSNKLIGLILDKCKELIDNIDEDPVYNIYKNIKEINASYIRTDEIIDRAIKRKFVGNPPTSSKNTCCDEIIWETLIQNCNSDLIIVSRDGTYKQNYNFLNIEYKNKTGNEFVIVDTISEAIRLNGIEPSKELENVESDLVLEDELIKYGTLQDSSKWINIIYNSLVNLGGEVRLKELYDEVYNIVRKKYPQKLNNKNIEATVRKLLQYYSSDTKNYNGKIDLFRQIKKGIWCIR